MIRVVVILALVGGCVRSHNTVCADNLECPVGTECATVVFTDGIDTTCVEHDQRLACDGVDEGMECLLDQQVLGTCHDDVCFKNECGNRLRDTAEACDDGNTLAADGCSATCDSNETCGNGVIDLVNRESCDGGDALSHDGCSSRCQTESPKWQQLENARPGVRRSAALVYDVARRRVVMVGGTSGGTTVGTTSEWDGRRWSEAFSLPAPLPRSRHAMAYDAERGQIVMFGGDSSREMWLRDREGKWSLSTPTTRPPALTDPSMVYDAGRRHIVLFGGYNTVVSNATWIWDGTTWTEFLASTRPPARFAAAMAYDPKRGVIVMSGGTDLLANVFDDVWEFDGENWVERNPAVRPARRASAAMAWDPISERVVLVGGLTGATPDRQTWAWDGQIWTRLADVNVFAPDTGLNDHVMTTDSARGLMVLVGPHGDVQEWNGTQWTVVDLLRVPAPQMLPRVQHAAALDPVRREVVVFGGGDNVTATQFRDTWIWNGTWRPGAASPAPSARKGPSMVFDSARGEMVMFGGWPEFVAETWVWKNDAWSQKLPASSPPARAYHASAYDPVRKKVVVFGGQGVAAGGPLDDTWTWNGTTWTAEPSGVRPEPRIGAAMAYDPVRDQIVLFGGLGPGLLGDTWTWNGQAWTKRDGVSSPGARFDAQLAWDAARQRIVLFGGATFDSASADVWEWDGADWALIPTANPPVARRRHTLVSALDGAGILLIGGSATADPLGDVWRLSWDDRGVQELCTEVDTDGDGLVGAADPDCWSTLSPLCPPATSCDPMAPRCGDLACNVELENCAVCPIDCGACAAGCGNFACDGGETMTSCPGDCGT